VIVNPSTNINQYFKWGGNGKTAKLINRFEYIGNKQWMLVW